MSLYPQPNLVAPTIEVIHEETLLAMYNPFEIRPRCSQTVLLLEGETHFSLALEKCDPDLRHLLFGLTGVMLLTLSCYQSTRSIYSLSLCAMSASDTWIHSYMYLSDSGSDPSTI